MSQNRITIRGPLMRRASLALLGLAASLAPAFLVGSTLVAQEATLGVSSDEVIPGGSFSLYLEGRVDRDFRGFQAIVEFPVRAMELRGVSLGDTVLQREELDVFSVSRTPTGRVLIVAIEDDTPPFDDILPGGTDLRLARLNFQLGIGLNFTPGDTLPVRVLAEASDSPRTTRVFSGESSIAPSSLSAGSVQTVGENFVCVKDLHGLRTGDLAWIEVAGLNTEPIKGFQLALSYDPGRFRVLRAGLEGTVTAAVGAEYVAPIIDNDLGEMSLGVLLDQLPPFDQNQVIPAAGFELSLAKIQVEVLSATLGQGAARIGFEESIGSPPIKTIFTANITNQSVRPRTRDGRISFIYENPFIRGDANEDGRINPADPVFMLDWFFLGRLAPECEKTGDVDDNGRLEPADIIYMVRYLFLNGPVVPPPFPAPGLDPTPDRLFCHS